MSQIDDPTIVPSAAEGSALVPPRRTWQYGIAPHYIGLFLWIVFSDQLGRTTLPVGGLGFSLLGALIGSLLCYQLLFKGPAFWGHRADRSTIELAARVFGRTGARISGLVLGLAEIVWFAVGIAYATEMTLDGLVACGFFEPSILRPTVVGRWTLPGRLFLVTSLFWCFAVALTATWLVRVIGAIMNAYPVFPAIALSAAMFALLGYLPRFAPTGIDPVTGQATPVGAGSVLALLRMIQILFGFFAMAGILSADWGKGSKSEQDVRLGGWVGVVLAPLFVAAIALITIAAYQGKVAPFDPESASLPAPGVLRRTQSAISDLPPSIKMNLELLDAIRVGIGGKVGGAMLLILGLGSLAPAVYSSFKYAHRFKESVGGISRIAWMLVATSCAWPLIATGATRQLDTIFGVMGAVFASMVGAYTAIGSKDRYGWTGERGGVNPSGMIGWLAGTLVGLLPLLPLGSVSRFQPAAFWAFVVAYLLTRVTAYLGLDRKPLIV